jgi:hypothetical protein
MQTDPNAFIGKAQEPTDEELAAALGKAKLAWDQLLSELGQELGVTVHEWRCYSPKAGWSLRVKRKARTIVWLSPRAGAFMAAFILGDKAIEAARSAKLPQRIVEAIQTAPKYPEGTGVRITVKSIKDLAAIKNLAVIKIAN